ncbi:hypothetical protein Hanom_Chr13g01238241 [Helianthus anomalus]
MNFWCCHSWYLVLLRGVKMSFYTVIQRCNQTALYWFSTYWFRPSYPFRPLIHSALIGLDVAKQPLNLFVNLIYITCLKHFNVFVVFFYKM